MKRCLLLVLVVVGGLVVWLSLRAPPRQSVRLPDGSVLTLREVSYGRHHRHVFGNVAQRLYALIPERFASRRGHIGVITDTNVVLAFWLTRENVPTQPDSFTYMLEDANGHVAGWHWYAFKSGIPHPREGIGIAFRDWPRRDPHLRLVIYQLSNDQTLTRLGTFTVPNPGPLRYPTWKSEKLPVTARVADYDFTLERLMLGVDFEGRYKPLANNSDHRALVEFRVTRNGQPTSSWPPASITISDATGNTVDVGSWSRSSKEGKSRMGFHSTLWPGEPWKLRVEFSCAADYSSNELVRFPPIPLPQELVEAKTTNTFAVNVSTNWQNIPVTVTAFERLSRNSSVPMVRVRCGPLPADHRLTLVKIEDDQKRNISRGSSGRDNHEYTYDLTLQTNSTALHLTLAIHKSVFAEFTALPTLVTSNSPPR
jgi:hypothetical protein